MERKKRKRWVHGFHSLLWQRGQAAPRNSFRQNTTKQIEQNQLTYERASIKKSTDKQTEQKSNWVDSYNHWYKCEKYDLRKQ